MYEKEIMMKQILFTLSAATALLLVGCGGGSSSTSSETVGYFVDAPVQNIDYDCLDDNTTDVTGEKGAFSCTHMNHVRFRIGQLILGEIDTLPNDGNVLPQDLLGVPREGYITDPEVTAMAQLLQSLDVDKTTVEIEISDSVKSIFNKAEHFRADDLIEYANEAGVTLIAPTTAQAHLRETLQTLQQTAGNSGNGKHANGQSLSFDFLNLPLSTLTPELKDALAHMGNEERLAYDVYTNLYNYHKEESGIEIFQLSNIANNSEATHVQTVQALVQRYNLDDTNISVVDPAIVEENNLSNTIAFEAMPSGVYDIPAIQELYTMLYEKGIASQQAALEVGCMVEVVDVEDLDRYIEMAQESNASDVVEAFTNLRSGSYNHYWSFDRGLKNLGVEEGCCALEPALGYEWCHPDFPQNQRGNH